MTALTSRIDDFDSSRLSLHFVVVQLHNEDTVFREFPVLPEAGTKGSKRWTRREIQDTNVILHPAPFYVGYAYRIKAAAGPYHYSSYTASTGGEGGWLSLQQGRWRLSRSQFNQILPFRISYVEL